MNEIRRIRNALQRLSCIARLPFQYDPVGQIVGAGPIHFLLEFNDLFFIAWEDSGSGTVVVNPLTRFDLDELSELGAMEAWTVLRVPKNLGEAVQFREIDNVELSEAYCQMSKNAIAKPIQSAMHVL
jgi:hypothetical protein